MYTDAPSKVKAPRLRASPVAKLEGRVRKLTADLEAEKAKRARIELTAARDERDRIIHALHDTICQSLSGACLEAAVLCNRSQRKGADDATDVKVLYEMLRHTVGELHDLVHGLQREAPESPMPVSPADAGKLRRSIPRRAA